MSWEQLLPQANTKMTTLGDYYQPKQAENAMQILHAADMLDQRQARQLQMKVAKLRFDTSVEHLEGTKALSAIAKPQQISPDDVKTAVGYVPKAQYMSWASMYKGEAANQQEMATTAATQAAAALQAGRMQYMIHQGIAPEQVGVNLGSPPPQPQPQIPGQDASTNAMTPSQTPQPPPTSISAMSPEQTQQRVAQIALNPGRPTQAPSTVIENTPGVPGVMEQAKKLFSPQEWASAPISVLSQRIQGQGNMDARMANGLAQQIVAQRGGGGQPTGQLSNQPPTRNTQAQQFVSKIVAANGDIEKLRKLRNDPIAMSTWGGKKLNDAINDAWKGGKGETGAQEKAEFLKIQTKINMGQQLTPEEQAKHDAYKQEKEIAPQAGFGFGGGQTPQPFAKWTDKEKKFWYDAWVADPAGTKAILPIDYRDRASLQAFGKGVADYQTDKGVSGGDTVVNKQEMKADSKALADLTKRETLTKTFTTRIDANTKVVRDAYEKYKQMDSRIVNVPRNRWHEFIGAGDLAALKLAMYSLEQEVGKVEKGSIGVAGLDVEASKVMAKIHDTNLSLKDIIPVLDMGMRLGKTATDAMEKQRKDLIGEMKGSIYDKDANKTETKTQYQEGMTATNPTTKQKLIFKGGSWQPVK